MTLAEVQLARPSRDYDGRYAAVEGPGTAEAFIEMVYLSLQATSPLAAR